MSDYRRTKIVCTLGPAVDNEEILEEVIKNGLNAGRFNFSHGNHEQHLERLNRFRKVCKKLGKNIPVILDTKGPEIRTGDIKGKITLKQGQEYTLTTRDLGKEGDDKICTVSHKGITKDLKVGNKVLIDDGLVELEVTKLTETDVVCKVLNSGVISSHKGVNLPNVKVSLPSLTKQDVEDLKFGCENGYDYIAASFIKNRDDVVMIRKCLELYEGPNIKIISKIESQEGIDNFDSILEVSDGIMVARGDLGVEIPVERVPVEQKKMIKKTIKAGKIVITATQMLESMIKNPRPTRAEVNDVANAVMDGTTCVMLSGETASGSYPREAVKIMAKICVETERNINYSELNYTPDYFRGADLENIDMKRLAINYSVAITASILRTNAIICLSKTGNSAMALSTCRPTQPIFVITQYPDIARKLSIFWGIHVALLPENTVYNFEENLKEGIDLLIKTGYLKKGDTVTLAGGSSRLEDKENKQVVGGIMNI